MTRAGVYRAGTHSMPHGHKWVVVDVETSGRRAASHRVLSLAALVLREDGSVEREFSTLLDPGCDPGPVEIHGLTRERLAGAPRFDDVADEVAELLSGPTMVAHNASFDYGFLDAEFQRVGVPNPIEHRLCTLALSRRLELDVPNHRLGTLAEYWQVQQLQAHDAYDDARVLTEVFTRSVSLAEALQLPLPVVNCRGRRTTVYPDQVTRVPSAFENPGRLDPATGLVQGMKIVISGSTRTPRLTLAARLADAGFDVMNSVSRQTSVVVCDDPRSGSAKVRRAAADGIPVISEAQLDELLARVVAGVSKTEPMLSVPAAIVPEVVVPEVIVVEAPQPATSTPKPLPSSKSTAWRGRRVLLMGGTHLDCVLMRSRIVQLGARPSLNLTAAVTDVLVLAGGESDRRMPRVEARGLPLIREADVNEALASGTVPAHMRVESRLAAPMLARGQVVDLPSAPPSWAVNVAWRAENVGDEFEVDVVAFLLGENFRVDSDQDFVFYNNPVDADNAVELSIDGGSEQCIRVDLAALPAECQRIVIAAAIDGDRTFGDLGAVSVSVDGPDNTFATFVLDAGTVERTMVLTEIYRRGGAWRIRAVGQGNEDGLAALATDYGLEVDG
ncbi:TerD family protein [Prescottella defluvii]|uniref:TerD family protein n=1 Tax=Prescottella defluvii TaxID=1323361 RepID=UPI000689FB78|nr:TerD family protein [Prescottella defluvii]